MNEDLLAALDAFNAKCHEMALAGEVLRSAILADAGVNVPDVSAPRQERSTEPRETAQPPQRPQAQNAAPRPAQQPQRAQNGRGGVTCPKCGGDMWDNRQKKLDGTMSERAPDFKCRDRENCDGVIWPPREPRPAARSNNMADYGAADEDWTGEYAGQDRSRNY